MAERTYEVVGDMNGDTIVVATDKKDEASRYAEMLKREGFQNVRILDHS